MTVWLVGVGPEDAELMTLKATRVLREADAVVFDRLIGDDVLDHVSPSAERYDVVAGEISDLLIGTGMSPLTPAAVATNATRSDETSGVDLFASSAGCLSAPYRCS